MGRKKGRDGGRKGKEKTSKPIITSMLRPFHRESKAQEQECHGHTTV